MRSLTRAAASGKTDEKVTMFGETDEKITAFGETDALTANSVETNLESVWPVRLKQLIYQFYVQDLQPEFEHWTSIHLQNQERTTCSSAKETDTSGISMIFQRCI